MNLLPVGILGRFCQRTVEINASVGISSRFCQRDIVSSLLHLPNGAEGGVVNPGGGFRIKGLAACRNIKR